MDPGTGPVAGLRAVIERAARSLAVGGLVAYPTEAVFGLGCDPRNTGALRRVLALKGRSARKGLIVVAASLEQLTPFICPLAPAVLERLRAPAARPTTWLVPAAARTSDLLTGGSGRLGIRITTHPVARALCGRAGIPLVSTSANRAGSPPARTARGARLKLGAALDVVVPGRCGGEARPSRIVDALSGEVLRP